MGGSVRTFYFERATTLFRFDGERARWSSGQIALGQPQRPEPFGRRRDQLARAEIEQADGEQGLAKKVAVGVADLLPDPPDLPDVGFHPGFDDDRLSVLQLPLKFQGDLEDGGADSTADHLREAVSIARDEVPPRLLEDLQILGVVDVPEGVEVLLADDELVFVHRADHGRASGIYARCFPTGQPPTRRPER